MLNSVIVVRISTKGPLPDLPQKEESYAARRESGSLPIYNKVL